MTLEYHQSIRTLAAIYYHLQRQISIAVIVQDEAKWLELQGLIYDNLAQELEIKRNYQFVWLNIQDVGTIHEFVVSILNAFNLNDCLPRNMSRKLNLYDLEIVLTRILHKHLILVIDAGFENLLSRPDEFDKNFFAAWKSILYHSNQFHLTMILAARRPLIDHPILYEADFLFWSERVN